MIKRNLYLVTYKRSNTEMIHIIGSNMTDALSNFGKYIDSRQDWHPGIGIEVLEVKFIGDVAVQLAPGL